MGAEHEPLQFISLKNRFLDLFFFYSVFFFLIVENSKTKEELRSDQNYKKGEKRSQTDVFNGISLQALENAMWRLQKKNKKFKK